MKWVKEACGIWMWSGFVSLNRLNCISSCTFCSLKIKAIIPCGDIPNSVNLKDCLLQVTKGTVIYKVNWLASDRNVDPHFASKDIRWYVKILKADWWNFSYIQWSLQSGILSVFVFHHLGLCNMGSVHYQSISGFCRCFSFSLLCSVSRYFFSFSSLSEESSQKELFLGFHM